MTVRLTGEFRNDSAIILFFQILSLTGGHGCEASIDCSGAASARLLALQGTRDWGRCAYVGEGGTVSFEVSRYLIHKQITIFGSWVTSLRAC